MSTSVLADRDYHRAWWSLALYPVTFVAAFAIGDALWALMGGGEADQLGWKPLLAAAPALLVFVLPGVLAVRFGRSARRRGRPAGRYPALIGVVIGALFVGVNVAEIAVTALGG